MTDGQMKNQICSHCIFQSKRLAIKHSHDAETVWFC